MKRTKRTNRAAIAVLALAATVVAAGCGTSSAAGSSTTTTRAPLPAGAAPSAISRMVCSPRAQKELADVLGLTGTVTTPTWVNHVYSCRYSYPTGSFTLSIRELSSWAQTYATYSSLGATLGDTGKATGLGQGAFNTTNGSIVVRKDWKILLVDISNLPAQFGVPPTSAADVAYTVADVIMGCWSGD